ncbi:hypothetical protein ACGFX8_32955 [Streptomyces sp. NPDC048362]|uniref:hypothetical protein n=1 Tax=Streptomyces sp. NPDC048362 TaxID=3365539 RepID=UPI00372369B0
MNTVQIIQLAGTAVFAICAIVVAIQAERYAKQAQASAARAKAAARRAEAARAVIAELREDRP